MNNAPRVVASFVVMGIDEAGRGPLVGAVYTAAVILNPSLSIAGLADSKTLSEPRREELQLKIKSDALAWAIANASVAEIDELNILQATMLAMRRAAAACIQKYIVAGGQLKEILAQVDGNRDPLLSVATECIVKGDSKVAQISAASILAKTARDASMHSLDLEYPQFGFSQHKGYGTARHMQALKQYGPIAQHRRSFAPVRELLAVGNLIGSAR